MPPTLILIRHAEAQHNATQNWSLLDPPLTDGGIQQCEDLQRHFHACCPLAQHIEHIIVSPMRRTIQTATLSLSWLLKAGIPMELDAMWQENSHELCDTGVGLGMIRKEWPALDFSRVGADYVDKGAGSVFAFSREANVARGQACLERLYAREERVIAVVSHGGFLRTAITRRRYANADYRIFTFGKTIDGRLELFEDAGTTRKGGGMGRSEKGIFPIREKDFPREEEEQDDGSDGDVADETAEKSSPSDAGSGTISWTSFFWTTISDIPWLPRMWK